MLALEYRKNLVLQLLAIRNYEKQKGTYLEWLKIQRNHERLIKSQAKGFAKIIEDSIIKAAP